MKKFNSPVYPLTPSFDSNEVLDTETTVKYIKYLKKGGSKILMTTVGTSQFNLMSKEEVSVFNDMVIDNFDGEKILGLQPLSLKHLLYEIKVLNYNSKANVDNTSLLILFPDRYYNDEQVVEFFTEVCEASDYPILVHGNILKKGMGGEYEYDKTLLNKLLKIDGFIGMKEEASKLMFATNNLPSDMEVIVAGGSMKRFWTLEPHGATTYLCGVGSFNPNIEEGFYEAYASGNLTLAKKIMIETETPLFDTFMTMGWHLCMRAALKHMRYVKNDRRPFIQPTLEQKLKINKAVKKLL